MFRISTKTVIALFGIAAATSSSAEHLRKLQEPRVPICRLLANGKYRLKNVLVSELDTQLANGAKYIGEIVPGTDGRSIFLEDCSPGDVFVICPCTDSPGILDSAQPFCEATGIGDIGFDENGCEIGTLKTTEVDCVAYEGGLSKLLIGTNGLTVTRTCEGEEPEILVDVLQPFCQVTEDIIPLTNITDLEYSACAAAIAVLRTQLE